MDKVIYGYPDDMCAYNLMHTRRSMNDISMSVGCVYVYIADKYHDMIIYIHIYLHVPIIASKDIYIRIRRSIDIYVDCTLIYNTMIDATRSCILCTQIRFCFGCTFVERRASSSQMNIKRTEQFCWMKPIVVW